jgi:hypothetical protein
VRAGLAVAEELHLVEADPHAGRDLGREADEPGVGLIVGGAGLARDRPAEAARVLSGALEHHCAQHVGDEIGLLGRQQLVGSVGFSGGMSPVSRERPAPPSPFAIASVAALIASSLSGSGGFGGAGAGAAAVGATSIGSPSGTFSSSTLPSRSSTRRTKRGTTRRPPFGNVAYAR